MTELGYEVASVALGGSDNSGSGSGTHKAVSGSGGGMVCGWHCLPGVEQR